MENISTKGAVALYWSTQQKRSPIQLQTAYSDKIAVIKGTHLQAV